MSDRHFQYTENARRDAACAIGYYDPNQPIGDLSGNLPHWRQEGVTYFVTFRLADSIPQTRLELWRRERSEWLERNGEPHDELMPREYFDRFVARFQHWLDAGHGSCLLARSEIRGNVAEAMTFFDGSRYLLREAVIMPNHVHAVVTPTGELNLSTILHSWKSYTAKRINNLEGTSGSLWQKESFDHIIRGPDQLERIENYIHNNPDGLHPDTFTRRCLHK